MDIDEKDLTFIKQELDKGTILRIEYRKGFVDGKFRPHLIIPEFNEFDINETCGIINTKQELFIPLKKR